jgi:hypothetical protein
MGDLGGRAALIWVDAKSVDAGGARGDGQNPAIILVCAGPPPLRENMPFI